VRNLDQIRYPLQNAIKTFFPSQPRPLVFLDGPEHDDKDNTFQGIFEHLCTTGGYPQPNNEVEDKICVWALDGWSKKDMTKALLSLYGQDRRKARKIYRICGGCMRHASQAITKEGRVSVRAHLESTVNNLTDAKVRIAHRQSINQDRNENRLRTIFVEYNNHKLMTDVLFLRHKVDSKFVMKLLEKRGGLAHFRLAYIDGIDVLDDPRLAVSAYEAYWHTWFQLQCPNGIIYFRDVGKNRPLATRNEYWVPGSKQFPNIDAALVCNKTLYTFQYTVQKAKKKDFDIPSFSNTVVFPLLKTVPDIKSVCILYVTPPRSDFKEPNLNFSDIKIKKPRGRPKKNAPSSSESGKMYFMVDRTELEITTETVFAEIRTEMIPTFPFLVKNHRQ
jgi:hypothetical protein